MTDALWQPIETAPKEVECLLYEPRGSWYAEMGLTHKQRDHPGGIYTGMADDRGRWSYTFMGETEERDSYFGDHLQPTHWMLPPRAPQPPEAQD